MLYVTNLQVRHGSPTGVLEHLSCFLPGLLTLGAHLPVDDLDCRHPAGLSPRDTKVT